ncbi:hypothetical protein CLOSTHATH_05973 [Hungatella hathewayi DSM 13479]|uniref:Uncharacterized protein n=1 Tax=Hungatella hathewayi DSM 13479 TaxID=566550 RepID=D3AQR7_9FIRM|nr:hypothetical protein CLOSTHATH_05973 [Hungatella hathewayi DSM 13479]
MEKLFDTFILKAGAGDFHMVFIGKQHFHCLWSMLNFPNYKKRPQKTQAVSLPAFVPGESFRVFLRSFL